MQAPRRGGLPPIAVVSKHAAREKSIRRGHPSTLHLWWARRPLASSRAVLLALLLSDPCDRHCPEGFADFAAGRIRELAEHLVKTKAGSALLIADLKADLRSGKRETGNGKQGKRRNGGGDAASRRAGPPLYRLPTDADYAAVRKAQERVAGLLEVGAGRQAGALSSAGRANLDERDSAH